MISNNKILALIVHEVLYLILLFILLFKNISIFHRVHPPIIKKILPVKINIICTHIRTLETY